MANIHTLKCVLSDPEILKIFRKSGGGGDDPPTSKVKSKKEGLHPLGGSPVASDPHLIKSLLFKNHSKLCNTFCDNFNFLAI